MVLAGLAGLGHDVLEELRALIPAPRSIRESLWLALGLVAVGDEHAARTIERALLEEHGRRFGPWVRLEVGTSIEDTLDAARLLLVLSARLGEPFAPEVRQYLLDHPSRERAIALEELAYIQAALARLPRAAGRFAWSIDGERHEVELAAGRGLTLVLTASQRATFKLEPLAGVLAVVSSWTGSAADVPSRGPVTITRVISPASNATDDRLVRIRVTIDFGVLATDECWQITDLAPSGLAPIARPSQWDDESGRDVGRPWQFDGQRVSWCASPNRLYRTFEYAARVVSPGTYRWEPTIVQSVLAPEVGAATSGSTYTIR